MKYIILDTSSNYLYLSISNEKETFTRLIEGKNNHSEKIMDEIATGLSELKMEVSDLERVICGIGPGSYTGLRVSLTVCKMFSWMKNIPLYAISSLDILGSGYLTSDGKYAITNVAKRDYIYSKIIEVKDKSLKVIQDDKFVLKEEFINSLGKDITLIDGANYKFNDEMVIQNSKVVSNIHDLTPNYLREALS